MTTINEVIDRYQAERLPQLSERTQYEYRYLLPVLRREFGDRPAAELKPKEVGRFLHQPGGKKQQRNKLVALLSSIMGLAVGTWFVEGVESNPCQHIPRHPSPARTRYVTDSEFLAVHARAPFAFALAMDLALLLGQRQGDILGLTWYQVEDEIIRLTQGKTKKTIGIKLTDTVIEHLMRARRQPPMMPRWYVVRREDGQRYAASGFRVAWNRFMNRMVAEGVVSVRYTFHDLRAKCASDKTDTVGIEETAKLLAHGDSRLTARVYKRSITMVEPLR